MPSPSNHETASRAAATNPVERIVARVAKRQDCPFTRKHVRGIDLQSAGKKEKGEEAIEQGRREIDAGDQATDRQLQAKAWHDGIQRDQQQGAGRGADEEAYGQGQLQGSMVQVCETCRYDEQKGEQIEGRMHGVMSRREAN